MHGALSMQFSTNQWLYKVELCDNLNIKIIESINFIVIKIIVFYYCDNSKFLDITVYYTKTNTLVPGAIMEQDMHRDT